VPFQSLGTAAGACVEKQKRLAKVTCGARNQASAAHDTNKNPENKKRFRGHKSNQTRLSLKPSSIQTVTVGLGVPPNHVLSVVEALVGCTTDRELHPAPKVVI